MMALTLGMCPVSFAATALSDSEMDQVSAGDWVILTDASGNQSVEDVYASNNTLDLSDDAQSNIQAVNNTNAVDSAVATQTNIASVTGSDPIENDVNGRNDADIVNYSPSDAYEESHLSLEHSSEDFVKLSGEDAHASFESHKESATNYSLVSTFKLDKTLDVVFAAASASSTDCKKDCSSDSASAALFLLDYDKHINAKVVKLENSFTKEDFKITLDESKFCAIKTSSSKTSICASSKSSRKNLGENNHLNLENGSQQALQAVSNVNVVGSGAAVQTNLASNVGVNGTITHINISSVVNGF